MQLAINQNRCSVAAECTTLDRGNKPEINQLLQYYKVLLILGAYNSSFAVSFGGAARAHVDDFNNNFINCHGNLLMVLLCVVYVQHARTSRI